MKIAYLNLKSHPRGNHMLHALALTKYCPQLLIEEDSALAQKSYQTLTSELIKAKKNAVPTTQEIIAHKNIEYLSVKNHNDTQAENALKAFMPDLIVLGDTRIIKPHIIRLAPMGIVNVHPGYLPDVRGNNPYIWSIIHNLPSGCSVHFIDEHIDTGPLLLRQKLDPGSYSSYAHFLFAINALCGQLVAEAVQRIAENTIEAIPQSQLKIEGQVEFSTFTAAPLAIKNKAKDYFLNVNQTKSNPGNGSDSDDCSKFK
ncbi:MAG: formyltransferase family protein [Pseudomonadota bacterium]